MTLPSPLTRLKNFVARPLVGNIFKVLGGNIAGNLLNMLAMAWIALALGPALNGEFVALINFALLFAQLADFGLNTTLIKYYRDYVAAGRTDDAEALMRRTLWLRLAILGVAVAGCLALARPIVEVWLKQPALTGLFRLTCAGILGAAVWAYCQAAMQARQQFTFYAIITTANHALRLGLVWLLYHLGRLNLTTAVAIMIAVPFLGIVSSARLWPRRFWTARMDPAALWDQLFSIFHFSKWIFLSSVITTIIMRLDIFLLTGLSTKAETGQYSMAFNLAQGVPLITAAVSTVLLPKLAATRRRAEMNRITGLFIKALPVLAGGIALLLVAAHLILPRLKNGMYQPCLPVFDLLVIGSSLSLILNPLSFFCLAFGRASWLTWMNLAQLGLGVALSLALIPWLGALGSGISALVVRLFAMIFLALAYRRLLRLAE